jgi:cation diffusion facilitator CzcD-associated flavoprotein CzcO
LSKPDYEVVVVGAGFSGLGAAYRLRQAGVTDFVVLEKADDVGGTWHVNRYPGCQCDVPSHLYSFSFFLKPDWSQAFAPREEIHAYLKDFVAQSGLAPFIRCGVEVEEMVFEPAQRWWRLLTTGGEVTARFVIAGIGPLSVPALPDVPGISTFRGRVMHSAEYDPGLDLSGARVAVIGTGASAIQIVPSLVDTVSRLYVFQRTPAWVLPRADRRYSERTKRLFELVPWTARVLRWFMYASRELLVPGLVAHPRLLKPIERLALANLKRQVRDPDLVEKLRPRFSLGCKRILLSNDYYPALTRPNVTLVPHALAFLKERSAVASDGSEHEVDAVIFATGFHVTDNPAFGKVKGASGETLADLWRREGMAAYFGAVVPGFPNLFLLLGPNTGLGHNSMVFMIESQLNFVTSAIVQARGNGIEWLEVRDEVYRDYRAEMHRRLRRAVWSTGCASWYVDENGNNPTMWPGFTFEFWWRTRKADLGRFRTTTASGASA